MAHFAELDDANTVLRVIVVDNNELLENGVEFELKGILFCQSVFGGNWIQTSYNAKLRKNYAGRGYVYDVLRDAFIPPRPFPSWTFNDQTCLWDAPAPYPDGRGNYTWNEFMASWIEVTNV
jgi:hypothetical protein